jgi:hypothetical protein
MSKLTTKAHFSIARMLISENPFKSYLDEFKDEVLRLLPKGTQMIGVTEMETPHSLHRIFEVQFDCPFFKNDFEFEIEFTQKILVDGEVLHFYNMITNIINLNEQKRLSNG